MQRELVPEQVKVNPCIRFPPAPTAKHIFKEGGCRRKVGDRKGQMKGGERSHLYFRTCSRMPIARLSETDE